MTQKRQILLIVLSLNVFTQVLYAQAKKEINIVLDAWHQAASDADFNEYFSKMTKDGVFIGTDATENWNRAAFEAFSKPYFDRGAAWSFTAIERNIYIDETGQLAWFDELLSTWMRLCRGSGIMKKVDGEWKIAHYVLSVTVPNETVNDVVDLKKEKDSILEVQIRKKKY